MFQSPDSASVFSQKTYRILVVDDEPTLRLGFSYALASPATHVDTAATGRQALEWIAKTDFNVIVLDLRMPDIDGLGVIQALRMVGSTTPIVLCTAALTTTSALSAIQHGVVDYLLKPIRPAELRGVVDLILHPHQSSFAEAMHEARKGNYAKALHYLEQENPSTAQTYAWQQVFSILQQRECESETFLLEEKIRHYLNALTYRLPSVT